MLADHLIAMIVNQVQISKEFREKEVVYVLSKCLDALIDIEMSLEDE